MSILGKRGLGTQSVDPRPCQNELARQRAEFFRDRNRLVHLKTAGQTLVRYILAGERIFADMNTALKVTGQPRLHPSVNISVGVNDDCELLLYHQVGTYEKELSHELPLFTPTTINLVYRGADWHDLKQALSLLEKVTDGMSPVQQGLETVVASSPLLVWLDKLFLPPARARLDADDVFDLDF